MKRPRMMHIHWICLLLAVSYSKGQHIESPCPSVFTYEGTESEQDRWFGTVLLSTDESLVGVRLDIKLDRPILILVSWLGDVTTEDNERFTILSLSQKLHPGPPLSSRFMVKFNSTLGNPQVLTIRLNGRQICPPDPNFPTDVQSVSLKNPEERPTRRPDPDFENNWGPSLTTEPPRRTSVPYVSEEFEHNPPKRENNDFYPENVGIQSTTKQYQSERDFRRRPDNHNTDYNDDRESFINNEQFSTTERYYNVRASDKYTPHETTLKPPYTNERTNNNERFFPTEKYNNYRDDIPLSNNYNQKSSYNPNYDEKPGFSTYNQKTFSNSNYDERPVGPIYNQKPTSNSDFDERPVGPIYNQKPTSNPDFDERPVGSIYNQKPTSNPNFDERPVGSIYNQKPTSNPNFDERPVGSTYNQKKNQNPNFDERPGPNYNQKTTHSPNYVYENERNNNERFTSTERHSNVRDDISGSNTYNQQNNTRKSGYVNEGLSSTEIYNNVRDITPDTNTRIQQKTTIKPNYKNENERNNMNVRLSTTEKYNVEDGKAGFNNFNQQKTTAKPINSNLTNIKAPPNKNNQPQKADNVPAEIHLSTNYQVSKGQSNKYPSPTTKNKNETTVSKEIDSNTEKSIKLAGKDSPIKKDQKSGNADKETSTNNLGCGRVEIPPQPLITNGQDTARGQWPWHIALYKIEGINLSYICGGSLVSSTVVVTAAHCVTKSASGRSVDADILVVYLGKYHLYQFSDDGGVQNKQVRDVHVHPQYNHTNFHNDIAVLTLTSPVEYTTYVRPVCLWDIHDTDLNTVEGEEGTVVGWGYDENDRVTEELKMARMPVVSQQTCIWSYPQFFSQFTSNKTFCAGFRKGTSVCNGDSGGGMVFSKGSAWYLRGLVSITVARQGLKVCDTNHYVVFTDVAKYVEWISQYVT